MFSIFRNRRLTHVEDLAELLSERVKRLALKVDKLEAILALKPSNKDLLDLYDKLKELK